MWPYLPGTLRKTIIRGPLSPRVPCVWLTDGTYRHFCCGSTFRFASESRHQSISSRLPEPFSWANLAGIGSNSRCCLEMLTRRMRRVGGQSDSAPEADFSFGTEPAGGSDATPGDRNDLEGSNGETTLLPQASGSGTLQGCLPPREPPTLPWQRDLSLSFHGQG